MATQLDHCELDRAREFFSDQKTHGEAQWNRRERGENRLAEWGSIPDGVLECKRIYLMNSRFCIKNTNGGGLADFICNRIASVREYLGPAQ